MQFESFHWLCHHGLLRVIIPCSTNMVNERVIFLRRFYFFKFSLLYFGGVFNKAIIPLAYV